MLVETNDFFTNLPRGTSTRAEIKFRAKMVIVKDQVTGLQEDVKWYKNNLMELHNLIL